MTLPDFAAIADDIANGRSAASHLSQLVVTGAEARHVNSARTVARSRWRAIRAREIALYDWLDDGYDGIPMPEDEEAEDVWITTLRIYEQVVDVRRLLADAGKEAS